MVPLSLTAIADHMLAEWRSVRLAELAFAHRDLARLMLIVLLAAGVALLALRTARRSRGGRVLIPAVLPTFHGSRLASIRHGVLIVFLAGLAFFFVALADPFTAITNQEVTYPGRRIAVLIDASSSMLEGFSTTTLAKGMPSDARFFTAVAAARSFIELRIARKYRDLIALIEFGDQSYVVTPFTNDYDNVLLSISLIADLTEFKKFPDQGTTIGLAIDQGVNLFKAFDYLNAAGNLLIIFSDGDDVKQDAPRLGGHTADQILSAAADAKIPVYFVRTSYKAELGESIGDAVWKPVVEKTGGKYYAAPDEASVVNAVEDIDRATATGKVVVRQYSSQQHRFSVFALAAAALWSVAAFMKLTVPHLNKFP